MENQFHEQPKICCADILTTPLKAGSYQSTRGGNSYLRVGFESCRGILAITVMQKMIIEQNCIVVNLYYDIIDMNK
jgi:nitrate reductase alpha subunit